MLKETETDETTLFSHFYHWWHFDWGGPGPPGYAYACVDALSYKTVKRGPGVTTFRKNP